MNVAAPSTASTLLRSLLPLIGVIIGWLLKSATDFLTASHRERITRRKCTFYLLRAWKALLDYERFVSIATSTRPDIEEYEPKRASFAARFLSRISEDKDSLVTGIDMLATIDPTAAAQITFTLTVPQAPSFRLSPFSRPMLRKTITANQGETLPVRDAFGS